MTRHVRTRTNILAITYDLHVTVRKKRPSMNGIVHAGCLDTEGQ